MNSGRLDNIEINFKSPESMTLQKSSVSQVEDKKYIWKLGVLLYTCLYGTSPWSFQIANGNNVSSFDNISFSG